MNVPNIGQGPESVTTLSRGVAGAESVAPGGDAPVSAAGARGPAPSDLSVPAISFTRLACFDVNGDGSIDTRSAAAGGDATLLVPTHAVDLPTYTRHANPMSVGRPVNEKESASAQAPTGAQAASGPGTAARANHAAESYQRYGQTPPAAPVPASPPAPDGSVGTLTR